jgi:hypothetical protein
MIDAEFVAAVLDGIEGTIEELMGWVDGNLHERLSDSRCPEIVRRGCPRGYHCRPVTVGNWLQMRVTVSGTCRIPITPAPQISGGSFPPNLHAL